MLPFILRMSRTSISTDWGRYCKRTWEEGNGRATTIYLREWKFSIIGLWEFQWKHHLRAESDEIESFVRSTFSHQVSIDFPKATARHTQWWNIWLRSLWYRSSRQLERKFWRVFIVFQKHLGFLPRYCWIHEKNAENNKLLTQSQRMLLSSSQLKNGTIISPLL